LKYIKEQETVDSEDRPDIVIVSGKFDEEPATTVMAESEDALAATRDQLTKTKTQYEQLLDSGKIKD
jgi:hypothetical protein